MVAPTKLFGLCSPLMASLFAFSASLQFNDPDWYFWFPLYATACFVNLVNAVSTYKTTRTMAKTALCLGVLLFAKVVIEDAVNRVAGFWSLDMSERVVREKFGSGLAVISMFLQLKATEGKSTRGSAKHVEYGMAVLAGVGYALSFLFFLLQKSEMKS